MARRIRILLTLLALAWTSGTHLPAAAPQPHPFLFLTLADVARARQAAKRDRTFARLAAELVQRARTNRLEDLPPLERAWWETAKAKPWRDTYPEVFHHTWIVPAKWAELARTCARANLLSPSRASVAKAKRALLALADYSFEFEHYDVGMNYTVWALQALEAYDILYAEFSADERRRLDACLLRLLAAVQQNDAYWVAHEPGGWLNNHYAWHKLCFVMVGLFYDRPELVEQALRGPKGVEFMLQHGFKDDGLWLEGSIPYQFAATAPLLQIAELLENAGATNRLHSFATGNGRSLRQAYDALLPLLWPDRTLPTIGDCYARRPHLGEHPDYEILFRRFREPAHAWLLRDRGQRAAQALFAGEAKLPPGLPPAPQSRVWPEMGYVALRSNTGTNYWSGKGWSVFATYSSRPVHDHADKLSLQLFADGHLWLPDLEARSAAEHAFSSRVQGELNRHTLSHNTLLVDGEKQRFPARPLALVAFSARPAERRVTIGDLRGELYPRARQLRTVILREDYVLDFFQAHADGPREFAWLTHVNGESLRHSLTNLMPVRLPDGPPWSYLRNARSAATEQSYTEVFRAGRKGMRLDLWCGAPMEIVHCGFPMADSADARSLPMRMARCRANQTWFLAVYRRTAADAPRIEAAVGKGEPDSWRISLRSAGKVSVHVVPGLGELAMP